MPTSKGKKFGLALGGGVDVVIEPILPEGSGSDFSPFAEHIKCGYEETTKVLPIIKKLL